MRGVAVLYSSFVVLWGIGMFPGSEVLSVCAEDSVRSRTIVGIVQNQDLRRVDQAIVQVRDQEGNLIAQAVTNQAGEFRIVVPEAGTYSVSAIQETYKSEYVVVTIDLEPPASV